MVSVKTTIFTKLHLGVDLPGDVVYAQTMESFLSSFSNLDGATIS